MVERTVLLKLNPPFCEPAQRAEVAATSLESLQKVPGVLRVNAAVAADDRTAGAWDVLLKVWFRSVDDIPGYIRDPAHRSYVDDYLKPKLEAIKTWNFEPVAR